MTNQPNTPSEAMPLLPSWSDDLIEAIINEGRRGQTLAQGYYMPVAAVNDLLHSIRDDLTAALSAARAALEIAEARIKELTEMLERRQRCDECGGSGAVAMWQNDEHGGYDSLEPCLCWSDAEELLVKYEKAKITND